MELQRGIDTAVASAGSQGKLAAQLGVTQQAVAKWVERGYAPLRRAQEIEAVFGVPRARLANPRMLDLLSGWDAAM
jgi:hypothetical protein